ncbi:UbiH/UbiF family hydroxylase [Bartonella ancashensis]|uniref:2-octaprenyl-6-methoxyphenol hydroxylase n=1 Tax=Bartonella ancashensis TaxID=1318743 RepID=A0A0M4LT95_9HYPH|nr:UbiH/UbiF family hydroxylase [Bartonella ancashensis]ALE03784.1 2-octaprenyl-6-methoxyphenol hydroxylase [Bartonella ancashensis]
MKFEKSKHTDIAVVGTGPVGLLTALSLAHKGYTVSLIGLNPYINELRTTALMMPAIHMLQKLNIWDSIECYAAALSSIRIIDSTFRLVRSSTVNFCSSEIGEEAFGYNIPNCRLNTALMHEILKTSVIKRFPSLAKSFHDQQNCTRITLSDDEVIYASIIIAADGWNSLTRKEAGIRVKQWNYPQKALILNFSHHLPHHNTSTEFHTKDGPFTQVPLPGKKSSLVWISHPTRAQEILNMKSETVNKIIEKKMQSILGTITVETKIQVLSLFGLVSNCFATNRTILVGEAAHVFPPIGAQGLNLGFRDVRTLIDILPNKENFNFNFNTLISRYNRYRKPDILMRTGSVHALDYALSSNILPIHVMRSIGFELLRNFSSLRNLLMREGMQPGSGLKTLMKFLS